MITDNYLNDAAKIIGEVKKEMEDEIIRLKKQEIDTGNLEHIQHQISKVGSFLTRIQEAFS